MLGSGKDTRSKDAASKDTAATAAAFIAAVALHRHPARELDPPPV